MIGKIKYKGKSFGVESLTDGNVYDCVSIETPFFRVVDDSGEDYIYSISNPGDLLDDKLSGKWEIVEDPQGLLAEVIK